MREWPSSLHAGPSYSTRVTTFSANAGLASFTPFTPALSKFSTISPHPKRQEVQGQEEKSSVCEESSEKVRQQEICEEEMCQDMQNVDGYHTGLHVEVRIVILLHPRHHLLHQNASLALCSHALTVRHVRAYECVRCCNDSVATES